MRLTVLMSDTEQLTGGDLLLAVLLAYKGKSAASRLRKRARRVRRGGLRYHLLRGSANALDKASDRPIETVRELKRARRQPAQAEHPSTYWE